MVANQKKGQLRVRIDEGTHQKLADLAQGYRGEATVSDIVRAAIDNYLAQGAKNRPFSFLSEETATMLLRLARELDRDPVQIVEDCIEGIHSMIESDEPPLITMEIKLRQKYYSNRKTRNPLPDNEAAS